MTKYISIKVHSGPDLVFNTKDITLVLPHGEKDVFIFAGTTLYSLEWLKSAYNSVTAYTIVNNINKAILAINGPTVVDVITTGGEFNKFNVFPI